jgi:hypothetical protein
MAHGLAWILQESESNSCPSAGTVQPTILRMIGAWQPMDPGFQTESVGASALVVPENFAPQHDLESQKDPAWRQE